MNRKTYKTKKLSILIPNYNSKSTIKKVIEAIVNSVSNCEVIIVDDHSTDDSPKLIKEFIHKKTRKIKSKKINIKLIKLKEHRGVGAVRNECIKRSSSNYLLFIDSDVIINKEFVDKVLSFAGKFDILFPKIIFPNGKTMYPLINYEKNYPLISTCFLISRKSLERLDYWFDPYYKSGLEDTDFFIRCYDSKLKAKYLRNVKVIHLFKERFNSEMRYYYEVRGVVYALRKLRKVLGKTKLKHNIKMITLIKHFICGVFNFNWMDWASYDRKLNNFEKSKMLFKKHSIISKKGSFHLVALFFKALFDGLRTRIKYDVRR